MIPYQTKTEKLAGTSYPEVWKKIKLVYAEIKKKTKRRTYIRSVYFGRQKIFFDFFWKHLSHKSPKQRRIRLKFFLCAIDLIRHSRNKPVSKINPNKSTEILH